MRHRLNIVPVKVPARFLSTQEIILNVKSYCKITCKGKGTIIAKQFGGKERIKLEELVYLILRLIVQLQKSKLCEAGIESIVIRRQENDST